MKISASILSNTSLKIDEIINQLDLFNIDFLHLDSIDNLEVFDYIKNIRDLTRTPIDLHIISSEPEKYFEKIIDHGVELVTFQYENLVKPLQVPDDIHSKIGLAITTETDYFVFEQFKNNFSFILFMTTVPGKSGGKFDEKNFDKIRNFKKKYPTKLVHVDGGVNNEISLILRSLGVNCAVSGSYLINSDRVGGTLLKLKSDLNDVRYPIKDFMLKFNELPTIDYKEVNLKKVLEKINEFKYGFCIIHEQKKFIGIVTDGDIRRALLKKIDCFENITVEDFINKTAKVLDEDDYIEDMLDLIHKCDVAPLFFPVIDRLNRLVGAISFNNLIKGEL